MSAHQSVTAWLDCLTRSAVIVAAGAGRLAHVGQTGGIDSIRVDQWLWAVRLFKTRSLAAKACKGGHVTVNGAKAKPATTVRVGDRIEARVADRERVVEVVEVIDKRVGAPIAATCLVDHSPPAAPSEYVPPLFSRDRGTGRPTKRDRRRLDRFRNR